MQAEVALMAEVVLIVDDNRVNRALLRSILRKEGFSLLEAEDGEEALEMTFGKTPDLILLDIMMPKKDGYEVCRRLKANSETAHIPVIFLSAKNQTEDKIKGFNLGAADYVTKPFDRGEVLARVRAQLKIARLTRELLSANAELVSRQEKIDEDLRAAAAIQRSLLPKSIPNVGVLDVAWRFMPCERIGGDIFNVVRLDEKHWGIYMLDVSGHGVPSALVAVSVSQMLHGQHDRLLKMNIKAPPHYAISPPSQVLETLDREYPLDRFDKFFTISYILIDTDAKRIVYSNAAHPPPVLLHRDGEMALLKKGGTLIGMGGTLPFEEGNVEIRRGDRLFLYTDGILEYRNGEGELYGAERLHRDISAMKRGSIKDHTDGIMDGIMDFGGHRPPQDDVTLLGIEFTFES